VVGHHQHRAFAGNVLLALNLQTGKEPEEGSDEQFADNIETVQTITPII
jgi:hypothetical protein